MRNYIVNQFPNDLALLNFTQPNSVILRNPELFKLDSNTIFFGGRDWENFKMDLNKIQVENQKMFVLSLFGITLIDLTFYTYFNQHYVDFRKQTNYPKFGWVGLGPHFENPRKLIDVSESAGILSIANDASLLEDFVSLFVSECEDYLTNEFNDVSLNEFLGFILNDSDLKIIELNETRVYDFIFIKLTSKLNINKA